MARFIVWLICCLTLMGAYGQTRDTLYVDEGYVTLERTEFDNKLDSDLYYQIIYDLDSVLLKKLFLNYYLGRLQPKKKSQLFGLLTQRNQMDTTQTMLIHYQDTLKRKEFYPKKSLLFTLKMGKPGIFHRIILF